VEKIPDWPEDERPMERIINLLAIKDFIIDK
jgi:hypothetical protein